MIGELLARLADAILGELISRFAARAVDELERLLRQLRRVAGDLRDIIERMREEDFAAAAA